MDYSMKKKFGLEKGKRIYDINSISYQEVHFAAHILAGKIMRKCWENEVPASVVSLAAQCANGVQYNWADYLCKEFFDDYYEVQEKGTTFHYAWLIFIIAMLSWRELEDSQFPLVASNVCEAAQYVTLWFTTQPSGGMENTMLFVLYLMDFHMLVNHHPHLSSGLYEQYNIDAIFKVDFHKVYIQPHRDAKKKWHPLPYLLT